MAYLARAARRQSIVEAAATVVARDGLSAVTARTVASELGGSQGQIHHHFSSTDELAADAWRQYAAREIAAYQHAVLDLEPAAALALFFSDLVGDSGEGHALARWAEAGAHAQLRGPVASSYVETLTQLTDVLTAVMSGAVADATQARAAAARLLMLGVGLAGIARITDDPPVPVRTVMASAIRVEIP
ncbi:TetR family transcriptional regulator [Nocardia goodfellowii]|uniref:AcrR family transcriptional regulator n=1 Tax=Nocardia goodfellowii TaxID=882446 RepID=A0ABS4QHM0_9NOCA|nr:TetR family transcriptional regulator [Nocardia goodfellowii]MBP2191193.1 AcrR family transcriptional regulator [Nocardia goodfellowii]